MTPSAEEMSWEAEIQVEVFPNSPDPYIPPEEWKKALEGEEGLEEMLLGDDPSRTSIRDGFHVGFCFRFQPSEDRGFIIAQATCHPAWMHQGEVMTDISTTVGWAEIRIHLEDPRALRVALQELG